MPREENCIIGVRQDTGGIEYASTELRAVLAERFPGLQLAGQCEMPRCGVEYPNTIFLEGPRDKVDELVVKLNKEMTGTVVYLSSNKAILKEYLLGRIREPLNAISTAEVKWKDEAEHGRFIDDCMRAFYKRCREAWADFGRNDSLFDEVYEILPRAIKRTITKETLIATIKKNCATGMGN